MTKPAKPGSLRHFVENAITAVSGYKDLSHVLRGTPEGKRADYLAFGGRAIIEQKEQLDSPEHRAKGRAIQEEAEALEAKHNLSLIEIVTADPPLVTEAEKATLLKRNEKYYNRQNQSSHEANKQIASTKRILGLRDAAGVLLLIFDQVPGMMPEIIKQRGQRDLNATTGGEPQFKHIDLIIFACRMKDMTLYGCDYVRGYLIRDEGNAEHKAIARGIRDTLKRSPGARRTSPKGFDPSAVNMLRQDIFAEPAIQKNKK